MAIDAPGKTGSAPIGPVETPPNSEATPTETSSARVGTNPPAAAIDSTERVSGRGVEGSGAADPMAPAAGWAPGLAAPKGSPGAAADLARLPPDASPELRRAVSILAGAGHNAAVRGFLENTTTTVHAALDRYTA